MKAGETICFEWKLTLFSKRKCRVKGAKEGGDEEKGEGRQTIRGRFVWVGGIEGLI